MQPPLLQSVVSMTASGARKWAGGRVLEGLAKGGGGNGNGVGGGAFRLVIRVAGARVRAPCQLPRHVSHHPSSSSALLPPSARQQQLRHIVYLPSSHGSPASLLPRNHHLFPASRILRGVVSAPAEASPSLLSSSSHYSHLSVLRSSSAEVPSSALLSSKARLSLCAGGGSSSSGTWALRVLGGNSAGTDRSLPSHDCVANPPLLAGSIISPPLSSSPVVGRSSLAAATFSKIAASSLFSRKISSSAVTRVARLEASSQATSTTSSCHVHTMVMP